MTLFPSELVPDLDLGDDHYLVWTRWAPDDLPANRAWLGLPDGEPLPVVERWGATVRHYRPDGTLCEGGIEFDGPWQRKVHALNAEASRREGREPPRWVVWTVECWEPLTVSPSLLCQAPILDADGKQVGACGDHGYIRRGQWQRA